MSTETTAAEVNPIDALQNEAKTDIGLRREENQDSFGIIENAAFRSYVVADGMGGVKGGAIASSLAIDVIREQLKDLQTVDERAIADAVGHANSAIFERGSTDPSLTGMGTTVVMLTFTGTKLLIANVGDSRAYRIRGGLLDQLTEDHTLVNELVRAGTITEEQASSHPVSHMLTRSLGPTPGIEVDSFESLDDPARGDVYLLCSDGLYNMVHPEEFVEVVQSLPIDEVAAELISLANLRGGADNITVILVKVGDEYPLPIHETSDDDSFVIDEEDTERAGNARVSSSIDLEKLRASNSKEHEEQDGNKTAKPDTAEGVAAEPPPSADRASAQRTSAGEGPEESSADTAAEKKGGIPVLRYAGAIVALSACITIAYSLGKMNIEPPKVVVKNELPIVVAPPPNAASSSSSAASEQQSSVEAASVAAVSSAAPESSLAAVSSQSSETSVVAAVSSAPVAESSSSAASQPAPVSRMQTLAAQIEGLQEKIAAFDKPISGKVAENLGLSLARIADAEKKEGALTTKLQEASTRLSKWLGLKRRLEEQNPIDLSGEVSEMSPAVKAKQDAFQRATWAYLQQYEAWQTSNNNPEMDKKVQQLAQGRNDAMTALSEIVKVVVDEEIAKSDKAVGDVTFERDAITAQLRGLRQEVAFARTLVGGDSQSRELMKSELRVDLQRAQTELKHLEILSPPPPPPVAQVAPDTAAAEASSAAPAA